MVIGSDVIDLLRRDFPVEYALDWNHVIATPAFDGVLGRRAVTLHERNAYSKNTVYLYDRTARWTYWRYVLYFKNDADAVLFRLRHG
jgi:hypothetical protein